MFTDPWVHIEKDSTFHIEELKKELSRDHLLFGVNLYPVAKRIDNDTVCFHEANGDERYFEVHLTWSGKVEVDNFPKTIVYKDFDDWFVNKCLLEQNKWID